MAQLKYKEIDIKSHFLRFLAMFVDNFFYLIFLIRREFGVKTPIKSDLTDKKFNKILIIRLDSMRDVLLTTPMIKALKEYYPDSKIHFLSCSYAKELSRCNRNIDKHIIYNAPWFIKKRFLGGIFSIFYPKHIAELFSIIKVLKKEKYDLAIDPLGDLRNLFFFCYMPRIKYVLGYNRTGGDYLLSKDIAYKKTVPEIEKHKYLLSFLGIRNMSNLVDINSNIDSVKRINMLLSNNRLNNKKITLISAGAMDKLKRWPLDRYIDIAKWLVHSDPDMAVVFIGVEPDEHISTIIKKSLAYEPLIFDMVNKLNIVELFTIMQNADFILSNENATASMTSAINSPTIIIFGPTQVPRYKPFGNNIYAVGKGDTYKCCPCSLNRCKVTFSKTKAACLNDVSVTYIRTLIQQILKI